MAIHHEVSTQNYAPLALASERRRIIAHSGAGVKFAIYFSHRPTGSRGLSDAMFATGHPGAPLKL